MDMFRQGDVLLYKIGYIPGNNFRPIGGEVKQSILTKFRNLFSKTKDRIVLAYGEQTGHHHSFPWSRGVTFFRDDGGSGGGYLHVADETANLTHQEHGTIEVPKGDYRVVQQRQFTPTKEIFAYD